MVHHHTCHRRSEAVAKAGLKMEDISYWELNEAFAVVASKIQKG